MSQPVRVAVISGSLRKGSYNTQLVRFVAGKIRGEGVETDEISLLDLDLPLMNEDLEKQGLPAGVLDLKKRLIAADVLLISSPEYNGSLSPALKNAACFRGKVGALLAASPGKIGGLRGLRHLRQILTQIQTLVHPNEFALGSAHEAFDEAGNLKDAMATKLAVGVGEAAVGLARAVRAAG
ncbi:NADPH-dependent FMN reductase [Nodularia spumigena]|uniref:NADPH-dependent FMN reductase n=1 Tax=Nodularia spumigena TaxID=70799 RepID=UPI002B203C0E|nr:NAD(P)H-dependent oxidoreductase [Nodularia spumigena]MEA5616063.1 NAD(P)H-dependent oxidoreductase [Nodularia spumigena UHCC 0040]